MPKQEIIFTKPTKRVSDKKATTHTIVGLMQIVFGIILCIVAVLLTISSYVDAVSKSLPYYLIYVGLILVGAASILRGVTHFGKGIGLAIRAKAKDKIRQRQHLN